MVLYNFKGEILVNGARACLNDHADEYTIGCLHNAVKTRSKDCLTWLQVPLCGENMTLCELQLAVTE